MPRALLIVDVQNDFCPGGALAVPAGDEVVEPINRLARTGGFSLVIATRDWHPPDHGSFADQGGPWPVHCVAGTPGAELHEGIDRGVIDVVVDKGQARDTDGYSGFEGTELARLLSESGIDAVTVTGLATDYCVKNTALDALHSGLSVSVPINAVRGVEVEPGDSQRALDVLRRAGASLVV